MVVVYKKYVLRCFVSVEQIYSLYRQNIGVCIFVENKFIKVCTLNYNYNINVYSYVNLYNIFQLSNDQ